MDFFLCVSVVADVCSACVYKCKLCVMTVIISRRCVDLCAGLLKA